MKPGFEVWLCLPCRTADPNSLAVADISKRGDCECCNKPAVLHKYRVTNTDVGVSLKGQCGRQKTTSM